MQPGDATGSGSAAPPGPAHVLELAPPRARVREISMKRIRNWAAIVVALGLSGGAQAQAPLFPEPDSLEPNVAFWIRVYSEIDTQSGLVHDDREMDVIYEVIDFPEGANAERLTQDIVTYLHLRCVGHTARPLPYRFGHPLSRIKF